jgi:hypothetical protein
MTQPTIFPMGRKTLAWVRLGGEPTRCGLRQRFTLKWQAAWFELNCGLERRLPRPGPLTSDPVFVLGLWRSGTTFMHELLSACPGLVSPSTWQCMNPSTFRLRKASLAERPITRPMDGMTIDALSPQEDEFALLALGIPSAYRAFLDPRRLPEMESLLQPEMWTAMQPEGWLGAWLDFLGAVAEPTGGRLVLKSPGHTFRLNALTEAFPAASYAWLVRDPVETFLSNRKMWLAMFERYALWEWDPALLDHFLSRAMASAAASIRHAAQLLPRERLAVVRFDQFTGAAVDTLQALNRRLSIGRWEEMHPILSKAAASKASYRAEAYDRSKRPPFALESVRQLELAQDSAVKSHGI